ncbi:MAG: septum formation initiator [Campylobacter sp.]
MNEVLKEYEGRSKYPFKRFLKLLAVGVCVAGFGIYVGNILFGKRSLDVMLSLGEQRARLENDVGFLKKQNAQLQKTYFELKELEP